ncbi:hypothetical protein Rifp1Sym_ad00140 [endosymbiont of Riftia pachyptila (vent Ph05)]|uniref:Uncharacterized protein n=1 Tax=endosymbiont of Riftia pachyptila (vent Ph05) TaxID=1048808 RepID=G2D9K5_9GAMM|nr:hypothetical protein Rifp1Sym_ad00140 [endosymbiont of Riftia pachyptila (vent Ph05)]
MVLLGSATRLCRSGEGSFPSSFSFHNRDELKLKMCVGSVMQGEAHQDLQAA